MYSNRPVLSNTFAQKIIFCAKAAACLPASGMAEGARQSLSPHSLPPGREQHRRPRQRICLAKNGAAIDGSNVPAAPPRGSPRQPEPQTVWAGRQECLFDARPRRPPASQAQAPHSKEDIPDLGNKKRAPASLEPVCFLWSGWRDLNARPQRPERCALAKLSHIPLQEGTLRRSRLPCKLFLQKNFSGHLRPFRARGISGKTFGNIGQLGFDFIKKGATTLMPVRLPGKNLFEVALCRTQDPRTISATARN